MRLAAQKESDKAQNGLLRETCCITYVHMINYIYEQKFCKCFLGIFLSRRGLEYDGEKQQEHTDDGGGFTFQV